MATEKKLNDRYVIGFGLSLVITLLFTATLTTLKEVFGSLRELLASVPPFYHHWATHGFLDIIIFVVLGFVFANMKLEDKIPIEDNKLLYYIVGSFLIGTIISGGYFLLHSLGFI